MTCWEEAISAMAAAWGKDTVFALGTRSGDGVNVRNVDGCLIDGAVYVTTWALSHKMQEIALCPKVGICQGVSVANGIGENLGHPCEPQHAVLRDKLRKVFSAFYDKHNNEGDPNLCILKIALTSAVFFSGGKRYAVDFAAHTATATPCVIDIVTP